MYTTEELLSVLLSIKHNAYNSDYLIQELGYAKLGEICLDFVDKGYIIDKNKGYILVEKGEKKIAVLCKELDRKGVDKEICKVTSIMTEKIAIDDIYLP